MPRYKLQIEYDGTPYKGWQAQDGLPTVQQAIQTAMAEFVRHPVTVFAAGRTDAGVHGLGQIIHVDLEAEWPLFKILEATNGLLRLKNHPISVIKSEHAEPDFDARFSAVKRHYRYRIINRPANLTVDLLRAWHVKRPLDVAAMDEAAKVLLGLHDFTTFRSTECQAKSPVRTLDQLDVRRVNEQEIEILCSARAFLHNQVRSLAGSLKLVGEGKWSKADLKAALEAKDRKACGTVAPACGLYFMQVDY
ncbi:MAG: tRNA pseudouridine(38-40) synthase TruA [Salaquimonas sp.]